MINNTLIEIIKYSKISNIKIFFALLFSIINQILDIFPDILIGIAIDIVINKEASFLSNFAIVDSKMQIIILGGITVIVYVFESITEFLYSYLWRNIAQNIQNNLRILTYNHMQDLELSFFETKSTGSLLNILVDDINLLEHYFNNAINDTVQLIVSTIVISIIFFYISKTIFLLTFSSAPIIFFITFYFKNNLKSLYLKIREAASNLASLITNNIFGIATIKAYTAESWESNNLKKASQKYLEVNRKAVMLNSLFSPIIRIAIMVSYIITMIIGGYYVINGYLAVGIYSVLISLTQRLLWPFTDFAWLVDSYERAMTSGRRILRILSTPLVVTGQKKVLNSSSVKGHIVFDNVSFMYPNGTYIFKNLSFEIFPGQTVAFVGSTGSGKSTIVKLLLKFYSVSSGRILIDGNDINSYTAQSVRKAISLVSQDVFLVQDTIKANIAYGLENVSFDKIIKAAKIAEAYNFIMTLPEKFDTIIKERGMLLSGGQKQRISIARAVLKNSPIFIFDEATSALDNETERAIQLSLEKIEEDHTTIIIAHRLSTIRNADKIFVMDNGNIVESGKHDELIELAGIYARLWHIQTGEIDLY